MRQRKLRLRYVPQWIARGKREIDSIPALAHVGEGGDSSFNLVLASLADIHQEERAVECYAAFGVVIAAFADVGEGDDSSVGVVLAALSDIQGVASAIHLVAYVGENAVDDVAHLGDDSFDVVPSMRIGRNRTLRDRGTDHARGEEAQSWDEETSRLHADQLEGGFGDVERR